MSDVSDQVESSTAVRNRVLAVVARHRSEIISRLVDPAKCAAPVPNKPVCQLGPWDWSRVTLVGQRTLTGLRFQRFEDTDLHFAFGTVTIKDAVLTGFVQAIPRASGGFSIVAKGFHITGTMHDLIDYDFNGEWPSVHGATFQLGYKTLGSGGGVYLVDTVLKGDMALSVPLY